MYEHLRGGLRNQIPKFQNPAGPITIYGNQYITYGAGFQMPFNPQADLLQAIKKDEYRKTDNVGNPIPDFRVNLENYIQQDQKRQQQEFEAKLFSSTPASGDGKDSKFKQFLNKGISSAKNYLAQNAGQLANMGMSAVNSWATSGVEQGGFMNTMNGINNFMGNIPGGEKFKKLFGTLTTGLNVINKLGGRSIDKYQVDQNLMANMGGSYGGFSDLAQRAADATGKTYGLFNGGGYGKAKRLKNEAIRQENIVSDINSTSQDQLAMAGNGLNYTRYQFAQNGGFDQNLMRAAKFGSKLERIRRITSKKTEEPIEEFAEDLWEPQLFKKGGTIEDNIEEDIFLEDSWEPQLFQNGGKTRTIQELIEYAKQQNPRFIQRLSEPPRGIDFIDDSGKKSRGSHYLESAGEYVIPRIQEVDGELKFFNHQDAVDRALETGNFLKMSPSEAILFAEQYKQGWPEFFNSFQKGGNLSSKQNETEEGTNQKNIIPEGALHKEKHHMENAEDLTKKGIPVIDNDGVQQAEIERDEIVFTLEVTKKLEDLYHKYYDQETSKKDDLAIEAGKILVHEILYNTEDRTGLISKCKEGGKLNET